MPLADVIIVIRWWVSLLVVGLAAYPLTSLLFPKWHDRGYFFAKAVGMTSVTWLVYIFGMTHAIPFGVMSILISLALVAGLGIFLNKTYWTNKSYWSNLILEELFFFGALLLWSWVKAHEPSLRGLEKFMDYGFMNSILHSTYFPPVDMWYPPYPINYYYFGHLVTAVLTKLSGIDLTITYNLMLASIFAWSFTMSFSIGYQLIRRIGAGILTAFLVTLSGNMQTLYAFTKGYTGEDVKPFWQLFWKANEFWTKLPEGLNTYWYANATRFIPYTIHEFPSYSFAVSDIHGHVLSIPFVLLAIALLFEIFANWTHKTHETNMSYLHFIFYGFLVGVLLMTNALDGPIYLGLFIIFFIMANWSNLTNWSNWKTVAVTVGAAVLSALPFLSHFSSFVNGVAVNCPPAGLANTKYGPLIFEAVDKCQKSPLWMMYLLWGFFWFCGVWLIWKRKDKLSVSEKMLGVFFIFSLLLLVFPEFFYFKDIYPQHFRSNTMFKLGYQAFIMFSIMSGYVISKFIKNKVFLLLLIPQLFLVSIYPIFSVRSYFGGLRHYESIYGAKWLENEYPDDFAGITWFNTKRSVYQARPERNILVEADGDSYTDYERFSVFTGMPTVVGWSVHEWLWRGSYDIVAPRKDDVLKIYESKSVEETRELLDRYKVAYVVVGHFEREKFKNLSEEKFSTLGKVVFSQGETVIYEIQ